jgi:hypothetical protein
VARFAISQEGADAMRQVSQNIISSVDGIDQSTKNLKTQIMGYMDDLGVYGLDIWAMTMQIDNILEDRRDALLELAEKANHKSDEILELIGLTTSSMTGGSGGISLGAATQSVDSISGWIKEINPNYHSPFIPPGKNPYHVNCGSCAFAVESRFQGKTDAVASAQNIGTDAGMEYATGKKCVYMSVNDIEQKLISMGPGSHLICGINRHPTPFGRPQAGHWFNAFYDGNKVYTIDGQSGQIYDWPHDYGDVSDWCALV